MSFKSNWSEWLPKGGFAGFAGTPPTYISKKEKYESLLKRFKAIEAEIDFMPMGLREAAFKRVEKEYLDLMKELSVLYFELKEDGHEISI